MVQFPNFILWPCFIAVWEIRVSLSRRQEKSSVLVPGLRNIKQHWSNQGQFFLYPAEAPQIKTSWCGVCIKKKPNILIYHLGHRAQKMFLSCSEASRHPQGVKSTGTTFQINNNNNNKKGEIKLFQCEPKDCVACTVHQVHQQICRLWCLQEATSLLTEDSFFNGTAPKA